MTLTLVGVATGDPDAVTTQSGVVSGIFDALERVGVDLFRLDASLRGVRKLVCAAASPGLSIESWQHRFHRGSCATSARTQILNHQLTTMPPSDAVLLIRNTYRPLGQPYLPFVDTTLTLVQRQWPPYVPWTYSTQQRLVATERAYLRAASHIFVVGSRVAESVAAYDIPRSRITIVGGGANWPVAHESVVAHSEPVVLFVGRDFQRKGGVPLLEAFRAVRARIPNAKLKIVGDAPKRVPDGVEVLGSISDRAHLRSIYRSARVCVLPAWFEPYGLVLTEAMSQGVPCVGSDVGAIPEIIDDGKTGGIVAAGDVGALAAMLTRYLGDVALAERHGEAARRRVAAQLTWDHVAERIVTSARRTLRSPSVPPGRTPSSSSSDAE